MDIQNTFDTIVRHLFEQVYASVKAPRSNSACAYRGINGARCAVGVIIADEDYRPEMDTAATTSVEHILARVAHGDYGSVPSLHRLALMPLGFLNDMQTAHDRALPRRNPDPEFDRERTIGNWVQRMRDCAKVWALSADVLDDLCIPTDLESRLL